jgi:hypothetical protein
MFDLPCWVSDFIAFTGAKMMHDTRCHRQPAWHRRLGAGHRGYTDAGTIS